MKTGDIERIRQAGLITDEQGRAIIEHFHLREDSHRFLTVLSVFGGVLVAAGIILLISANWEDIPDAAKIAGGLLLMLGAHAGGWWLRDAKGGAPRVGEALYLVGALLFLANIALLGQIFHLTSRLPNAFLAWWIGIAALPWILRSRPLHALSLVALTVWMGSEAWQDTGLLAFGGGGYPLMLFALLGLCFYGFGLILQPTAWVEFSEDSERIGLFLFAGAVFPFCLGPFHRELLDHFREGTWVPFAILAPLALGVVAWGLSKDRRLSRDWTWAWGATLGALVVYLAVILFGGTGDSTVGGEPWLGTPMSWIATVMVVAYGLIQVRVGLQQGATGMVNLGIALVAAVILSTYVLLVGTMGQTGLVFVVSGVFFLAFGVYMEKQRRKLLRRMRTGNA